MTKANISWNVKQVANSVKLGSMTFDNAIQRGHVWDAKRQSLFIDSLLRNYPVPAIYTIKTDIDAPEGCKKGSKVFDCIDGKQRCEAIRRFRNNELALVGLEPYFENGEEVDINGKTYQKLSEEMRDAFDGYVMTVYFFVDITDDEISEMMSRLNNGKPLTGVENARIKAKNLSGIIELSNHGLFWENMTETAIKSYNNEDVVIKTALQIFENQFELSTKNVKEAYERLELNANAQSVLGRVFDKTREALNITGENVKKPTFRKIVKKTNLVNFIYLVSQHIDDDSEGLADFIGYFFDEKPSQALAVYRNRYNEASTDGTNHASNVAARNNALSEALKAYREMRQNNG